MSIEALERQLNIIAKQAFEAHNWDCQPLFPNILVRVFDFEEARSGLLILPDNAQKPNHRAIVIRTWEPIKSYYKGDTHVVKSELQPGDIVVIPYWAGVPTGVNSVDEAGYRIVPENKQRDYNTGRIISYGATQETPHIFFKQSGFHMSQAVERLLDELGARPFDKNSGKIVNQILDSYIVIPKRLSSVE